MRPRKIWIGRLEPAQEGNSLHRLAQTHLVRQDRANLLPVNERQPMQTALLVRFQHQVRTHAGWFVDRQTLIFFKVNGIVIIIDFEKMGKIRH